MSIFLGEEVTWGSGTPRGRVVSTFDQQDEMDNVVTYASLKLTADLRSPCGRVWSVGKVVVVPMAELRRLS